MGHNAVKIYIHPPCLVLGQFADLCALLLVENNYIGVQNNRLLNKAFETSNSSCGIQFSVETTWPSPSSKLLSVLVSDSKWNQSHARWLTLCELPSKSLFFLQPLGFLS